MTLLDEAEYARWRETASGHLDAARDTADGGHHHVAVLLSEQAAQNALKAVLHGLGATERARTRDLLALADAGRELAGLDLTDRDRESLADLARDYLPTRYPDALPAGTPQAHYGPYNAERALATARTILTAIDATWAALTTTATGGDHADGG